MKKIAGLVTLAATLGGLVLQPSVAQAAAVGLPSLVAYVRGGDVYVSKGAGEKRPKR